MSRIMKKTLACGVIFLLAVVGVVLVVLGSKDYQNEEKPIQKNFILSSVLDVGGSGTRLYVYKYSLDFKRITQHSIRCEDQGIGNYVPAEYGVLKQMLVECYKKGQNFLPEGAVTPIWVGATAGMRLLRNRDMKQYHEIWTLINDTLKTTNYNVKFSDTIPGNYEARYSWLAANILEKTLRSESKVGLVESGSSSIQIAFAVNSTADSAKHIDVINVGGKNVSVYEYSYLCYGEHEMLRKLYAELVSASNFSLNSTDPCTFKGDSFQKSANYLWSVPCVKGKYAKEHFGRETSGPPNDTSIYNISGNGNATKCYQLVNNMITTQCKNNQQYCGMEDVFQPVVRGKFLAIGNFFYATSFMGLPFNGNQTEYWEKTKELCSRTYDKVVAEYTPINKYTSKKCFHSVLTYFLLVAGFKFESHNWDIEYRGKINGVSVEWPLGLSYNFRDEGYFYTIKESKSALLKLIFGGILIAIAVVLAFATVFKAKKDDDVNNYEKM